MTTYTVWTQATGETYPRQVATRTRAESAIRVAKFHSMNLSKFCPQFDHIVYVQNPAGVEIERYIVASGLPAIPQA